MAAGRLDSYDVNFELAHIVFVSGSAAKDSPTSIRIGPEAVRDVYSRNAGRRVEQVVEGEPEAIISVIAWDDDARRKITARDISLAGNGYDYWSYINPNVDGYFLSDVLSKADSQISLNQEPNSLTIDNPRLYGPVRVAYDADRNYVLTRLDTYIRNQKGMVLRSTLIVDELTQRESNSELWVPMKGRFTQFSNNNPVSGVEISVDADSSSWNSRPDEQLFAASSLPLVNSELRQWNQYYPASIANAMGLIPVRRWYSWTTVLVVLDVVIVAAIIVWNRRRLFEYFAR
jgi:hypothetical protein